MNLKIPQKKICLLSVFFILAMTGIAWGQASSGDSASSSTITLTDSAGRNVEIPYPVESIVALNGNVPEEMIALRRAGSSKRPREGRGEDAGSPENAGGILMRWPWRREAVSSCPGRRAANTRFKELETVKEILSECFLHIVSPEKFWRLHQFYNLILNKYLSVNLKCVLYLTSSSCNIQT